MATNTDGVGSGVSARRSFVRRGLILGVVALVVVAGLIFFQWAASNSPHFGVVGPMPNRVVNGPDRDVPCDEVGGSEVCATPLPTLTESDRAQVIPLEVANLNVRLDHLGAYRVPLGQAVLARGIIEVMSLSIANTGDGFYSARFFALQLEDATTGKVLPGNVYAKGIVDGLQRVNVYLSFDLQSHKPGAIVAVDHVEVR
jgi:hypothetical protein